MKMQKAWLLAVLSILTLMCHSPVRAQLSGPGGGGPIAVSQLPVPGFGIGQAPLTGGPLGPPQVAARTQRPLAFAPSQIVHYQPTGQGGQHAGHQHADHQHGPSMAGPGPGLPGMRPGPGMGPGMGMPPQGMPGMGMPPMGMPPMGMPPMRGPMPGQMMPPYAQQAMGMGPGGPAGPPMGGVAPASTYYGGGGEAASCSGCNGVGCDHCLGSGHENGFGMGMGILNRLLPYAEGGYCAPRYLDFSVEALMLKREDVSRQVNFMSDGPRGLAPPLIILGTDNLSFDNDAYGFRFNTALQLHAGGTLEFEFLGQFNWNSTAQVNSAGDLLYSAFSDYGNDPPPQVGPIVRGGYSDTDSAEWARIDYSSNFDTLDLTYRKRWTLPNCRFQGSWLAGVRYFKLDEQFRFRTLVNYPDPNGGITPITGNMQYDVGTSNSMTGAEIGGDVWATMVPGVRMGVAGKVGLFGNRASSHTNIAAATLATPVVELLAAESVSMVAEANFNVLWRVNQHWTIKGGYELLYVDGVALAPENFNAGAPFAGGATPRKPVINVNGDLFLHGINLGLEYMW